MPMLYKKCWICGNTREVFPYSGECVECYQRQKHIERRVKRATADPAEAMRIISGMLKGTQLLRDCGLLTPLQCGQMQEVFLGVSEQLRESINSGENIQAELEAQDVLVNKLLSTGAVQAGSLGEAQEIISAKDAERAEERKQQQELVKQRQEELARQEAQQKAGLAKLAEVVTARKKSAA